MDYFLIRLENPRFILFFNHKHCLYLEDNDLEHFIIIVDYKYHLNDKNLYIFIIF